MVHTSVPRYGTLPINRKDVLQDLKDAVGTIFNTAELEQKLSELETAIAIIGHMAKDCINTPILSDDGRKEKFDELAAKLSDLQKQHTELEETIRDKRQRAIKFRQFYKQLEMQENFITEFDVMMFASLVDHGTIYPDGHISFTFRDGKEI